MLLQDELRLVAPPPTGPMEGQAVAVGGTGLQVYFYWVVSHFPIGAIVNGPFPVFNAPTPLNFSQYVRVWWQPALGATGYDLLRTSVNEFPSTDGPWAFIVGTADNTFNDVGGAPFHYSVAGLPYGSPVNCRIHLNNRDYSQPTMVFPCQIKVGTILFSDGTTQNTAGGEGGGIGPVGPQGPAGPQGAQGAAGAAITIQGTVDSEDDLPATGSTGQAWITEDSGHLWVWSASSGTWVDVGEIVGPPGPAGPAGMSVQGPPGPPGPAGPAGTAATAHDVSGLRNANVYYTNNTGVLMFVSATINNVQQAEAVNVELNIPGVGSNIPVAQQSLFNANNAAYINSLYTYVFFAVPPNASYAIFTAVAVQSWLEYY